MSCNTKTSLAAVIDAVNAQLNNNYVDRDDPRIDQGVFTEPTIRGGLMLDEEAKLDFCGYVTECGQREPFGKQWVDRPLYPDNTLVSYEDGGEIKSRWQDTDDVVAGTEIGESYTAYEETRSLGLQGYTIIDSFELGATITQRNEALRHTADGKLYRWAGDLPKVVPASSTPESSGGIATNAWLEVSDVTLRQDLANPDMGAAMVAYGSGNVSEALDNRTIYVGSVAELVELPSAEKVNVYLIGYHPESDYGGGMFYWDANRSKSDHNGGTVIDPSKSYPNWESESEVDAWFNTTETGSGVYVRPNISSVDITWFGAINDSEYALEKDAVGTDNSLSLKKAFSVTENIYIPAGYFAFDQEIEVVRVKVLQGAGDRTSFLVSRNSSTGLTIKGFNKTISDFTLKIGTTDFSGSCLILEGVIRSDFKNLSILGNVNPNTNLSNISGNGIYTLPESASYMISFHHVDVRFFETGVNLAQGVSYNGDLVFSGQGEIQDNLKGVVISDSVYTTVGGGIITFRDYTIEGNRELGVFIGGGLTGINILQCWFEKNFGHDIKIGTSGMASKSHMILIEGNIFGSTGSDIKVEIVEARHVIIRGNRVSKTVEGIYVPPTNSVDRLEVIDNTASNLSDYNIKDAVSYYFRDRWLNNASAPHGIAKATNGTVHKIEDGTVIVRKRISGTTAVTYAANSLYMSDIAITDIPTPFNWNDASINVNLYYSSTPVWISGGNTNNRNAVRFRLLSLVSLASVEYSADITVIGTWK